MPGAQCRARRTCGRSRPGTGGTNRAVGTGAMAKGSGSPTGETTGIAVGTARTSRSTSITLPKAKGSTMRTTSTWNDDERTTHIDKKDNIERDLELLFPGHIWPLRLHRVGQRRGSVTLELSRSRHSPPQCTAGCRHRKPMRSKAEPNPAEDQTATSMAASSHRGPRTHDEEAWVLCDALGMGGLADKAILCSWAALVRHPMYKLKLADSRSALGWYSTNNLGLGRSGAAGLRPSRLKRGTNV